MFLRRQLRILYSAGRKPEEPRTGGKQERFIEGDLQRHARAGRFTADCGLRD